MNNIVLKYHPKTDERFKIAEMFNINTLTAQLLINRNITEPDLIFDFLYGTLQNTHSPYLMEDMKKAVDLIKKAFENQFNILIFGDYDCDGITSTTILYKTLKEIGFKNVSYLIPNRFIDGYGFKPHFISYLVKNNINLLITVDNGITSIDAIRQARENGVDVIVIDHHQPGSILPPANAILNPLKQTCNYPYKKLCGVGVTYKFCQAIFDEFWDNLYFPNEYLDYVAIGTIADVVDLDGENRFLVKYGLEKLKKNPDQPLKNILNKLNITPNNLKANTVAFQIGPLFNAVGRLDKAQKVVDFLIHYNPFDVNEKINEFTLINKERQSLTLESIILLDKKIKEHYHKSPVLCLYQPGLHEGVIGLIASKIKEKYFCPVLIFTDSNEKGVLKGSGRSIEGYDLITELRRQEHLFLALGGHKMAAGFSITKENFYKLQDILINTSITSVPQLKVDAFLPESFLTPQLLEFIEPLEPFGKGNPAPIFTTSPFELIKYRTIGSQGKHIEYELQLNNEKYIAYWWDGVYYSDNSPCHNKIELFFTPTLNYQGILSFEIKYIKPYFLL